MYRVHEYTLLSIKYIQKQSLTQDSTSVPLQLFFHPYQASNPCLFQIIFAQAQSSPRLESSRLKSNQIMKSSQYSYQPITGDPTVSSIANICVAPEIVIDLTIKIALKWLKYTILFYLKYSIINWSICVMICCTRIVAALKL